MAINIFTIVTVYLFPVYEAGMLYTGIMIIRMLFVPFVNILARKMSKC